MARLYPPSIPGTLPAFYNKLLEIPYTMNKTVSVLSIAGFALRVKSASTEQLLFQVVTTTGSAELNAMTQVGVTWDNFSIQFSLNNTQTNKLKIGEFYKVQIAYIEDVTFDIGYFSSIGIIKYTGQPTIGLLDFNVDLVNENPGLIQGYYVNQLDPSEKVSEYRFVLYDQTTATVLDDTGWKQHLLMNDVDMIINSTNVLDQIDHYQIKYILENATSYFVKYMVRTFNGLEIETDWYEIIEQSSVSSTLQANLIAELDYENACVTLKLVPYANVTDTTIVGAFEIGRSSSLNNFKIWDIIESFSMNGHLLEDGRIFNDFTIEHGQTYKYAIRQKNSYGIYSQWIPITKWRQKKDDDIGVLLNTYEDWIYDSYVIANFEDAFLYDGQRQLKIKFNPKVNSFKTTLSDSKKTAIGSKYPYFFRNGIISYKEFQISGLISYLSDENEFFASKTQELGMSDAWQDSTDITDENMFYERQFKMTVLDWLNEDNVKLFKSPGEGNYLVRLSNVSLTPNDSLSRMIHTFNCTATEVAELTTDELVKEGFLSTSDATHEQMIFFTKILDGTKTNNSPKAEKDIFLGLPGYYVKFEDFMPGTEFSLGGQTFVIGSTGQYEAQFDTPVRVLKLTEENINKNLQMDANTGEHYLHYGHRPSITVGVKSKGFTTFDLVVKATGRKRTFINVQGSGNNENILEPYFDAKHEIERIYYIQLMPKQLIENNISIDALQAYVNKANERLAGNGSGNLLDLDIDCVYKFNITDDILNFLKSLKNSGKDYYKNIATTTDAYKDHVVFISIYCDGDYRYNVDTSYSCQAIIGKNEENYHDVYGLINKRYVDNIIDVSHTTMLSYTNLNYVPCDENQKPYIKLGNGVSANFGLYQKIITYDMELDNEISIAKIKGRNPEDFIDLKDNYYRALQQWEGTANQNYKDNAYYLYAVKGTISLTEYNRRKTAYDNARTEYMAAVQNQLDLRQEEARA